jgi:hypothetical protein
MLRQIFWIVATLGLAACSRADASTRIGDIEIMDAWVASTFLMPDMDMNGAAYMTIWNRGVDADRLVAADTDAAEAVEFHQTSVQNNIASMQWLESIDIPAQTEVRVAPGAYHLMLVAITRELKVGETITLRLTFAEAGMVVVTALVRER